MKWGNRKTIVGQAQDNSYEHSHSKKEKMKEIKGPFILSKSVIHQGKFHQVSRPEGNPLCLTAAQTSGPRLPWPPPLSRWPCSLGQKLCSCSHSSCFFKVRHVYSWDALLAHFLPVGFCKSKRLLSLSPASAPLSPSWQCSCWYNILQTLWFTGVCHRTPHDETRGNAMDPG